MGDSEALTSYLDGVGIRYVAYSYKNEANFAWRNYNKRTRKDYPDPWGRAQARLTFAFQRHLYQLAKTRLKMYDDGEIFVLDLATDAEEIDETNERVR